MTPPGGFLTNAEVPRSARLTDVRPSFDAPAGASGPASPVARVIQVAAALDLAAAADEVTALAAVAWESFGRPEEGPVAAVIRDALEGAPEVRPATAAALLERLEAAAAALPIHPPTTEAPADQIAPDAEIRAPFVGAFVDAPLVDPSFGEPVLIDSPAVEPPLAAAPRVLPRSRRTRVWSLGVAIALAIGLLIGFVGGFLSGVRNELVTPVPVVATAGSEIPMPVAANAPPAGAVAMQDFPPAPAPAPAPVPAPERAASAAPPSGVVYVVSRPMGAEVVLDGRSLGATPVTADRIAPGRHVVRLTLPGYRTWVGPVDVTPGQSVRVAASLEQ